MQSMRGIAGLLLLIAFSGLAGCGGGSGSAPVSSINISPISITMAPGVQRAFFYVIKGSSSNLNVTWSVQEAAGGTVTQTGLYTAPTAPGLYHLVVTSQADPTKFSTANITVQSSGVSLNVSQHNFTVLPGGSVSLASAVSVTGSANTALTWALISSSTGSTPGTITQTGVFTAPAAASGIGTDLVQVSSAADPTQNDYITITVENAQISILPATLTIQHGQSGTFGYNIKVEGSSDNTITWFESDSSGNPLSGGITSGGVTTYPDGTKLDQSGHYTAPATPGTYYITVQSNAVPSVKATSTVTVQ